MSVIMPTNSRLTTQILEAQYAKQVPHSKQFFQPRAYVHMPPQSRAAYRTATQGGWPTETMPTAPTRAEQAAAAAAAVEAAATHERQTAKTRGVAGKLTAAQLKEQQEDFDASYVDPKQLEAARRKKGVHAIFTNSLSALPPSFATESQYGNEAVELFDPVKDVDSETGKSKYEKPNYFRHGCIERDFFSDVEESGRFTSENGHYNAQIYYSLVRPLQGRMRQ